MKKSLARIAAIGLAVATLGVQAQQYCRNDDSLPINRFQSSEGGLITDTVTGLQWQRCIVGLQYNDVVGRCIGMPRRYNFEEAEIFAERESERSEFGWRVPSRDELATLVISDCRHPALDTSAFPNTPISSFWSNSVSPNVDEFAWAVYFGDGESSYMLTSDRLYLRLVRGDLTSLELIESAAASVATDTANN